MGEFDLIRRYQIPCEARQNGTLRAAYNEASAAGIESTAKQCIRRGMPVTLLNREQMREMTGGSYCARPSPWPQRLAAA